MNVSNECNGDPNEVRDGFLEGSGALERGLVRVCGVGGDWVESEVEVAESECGQGVFGSIDFFEELLCAGIVELLNQAGIDIARRTVAKYREALRIPSSVERKRRLKAG